MKYYGTLGIKLNSEKEVYEKLIQAVKNSR